MPTRHSLERCYGSPVRFREVAGLFLTECTYLPGLRMPRHWHEYAQFYLILEGACTDTCRAESWLRQPAALAFHPAGEPHASHYHDTGARLFNIELEPRWQERLREHSGALNSPHHFE